MSAAVRASSRSVSGLPRSPPLPSAAPGRPGQRKEIRQAQSRCPLLLAPLAATHRTASAEEVDRSAQGSRKAGLTAAGTTSTGCAPSSQATPRSSALSLPPQERASRALSYARALPVASELPGVQLLCTSPIPSSRKDRVAYTDATHGERLELIFDSNSTLLANAMSSTSSRRSGIAVPAGTVVGYTLYLASRLLTR